MRVASHELLRVRTGRSGRFCTIHVHTRVYTIDGDLESKCMSIVYIYMDPSEKNSPSTTVTTSTRIQCVFKDVLLSSTTSTRGIPHIRSRDREDRILELLPCTRGSALDRCEAPAVHLYTIDALL